MIVAVDGPAGAGKSTVAKRLAQRFGCLYIDTGAMYRALTVKVLDQSIALSDTERIVALARTTRIELKADPAAGLVVLLDGRDVSTDIRQLRVTSHVSDIAKIKEVREVMVDLQRSIGARQDCVLDGRDIGTVVFPHADVKFFIDADFSERVNRRYRDMVALGSPGVTREQVAADLKNRDTIDSTRQHAPLRKADDAILIDTTALSIDEVVEAMACSIPHR